MKKYNSVIDYTKSKGEKNSGEVRTVPDQEADFKTQIRQYLADPDKDDSQYGMPQSLQYVDISKMSKIEYEQARKDAKKLVDKRTAELQIINKKLQELNPIEPIAPDSEPKT